MPWSWQLLWWMPAIGLALWMARTTAAQRALARRLDEHERYAGEALYRMEVERGKCRPDRPACRSAIGPRQTRPY